MRMCSSVIDVDRIFYIFKCLRKQCSVAFIRIRQLLNRLSKPNKRTVGYHRTIWNRNFRFRVLCGTLPDCSFWSIIIDP